MKKWMMILLSAIMLFALCIGAQAQENKSKPSPPQAVLNHIAQRFASYSLEGYCEIDAGDECFGFALLTAGDERLLAAYREEDGEMAYWFKNHGAVPQGAEQAWFTRYERGERYFTMVDTEYTADGDEFAVTQIDELGESYDDRTMYHYDRETKMFHLISYQKDITNTVWIGDGELIFGGIGNGYEGRVQGEVQTDIRYVSFDTLPRSMNEARRELTSAPDLEQGIFEPKEVKFTGGRNYPVYTGPGEHFARSGNGKGTVSTNDWIQVFGRLGDWIMIQYDIDASRYRIGWIEADALPRGAKVASLDHLYLGLGQTYWQDVQITCALTDDPFNSREAIVQLPKGTLLRELVYDYMGWSYIWVEIDGQVYCGFVPSEYISHG